jgi:hypothetical protein
LGESLRAGLRFAGRQDDGASVVLLPHRLFEAKAPLVEDAATVGAERALWEAGDLACQPLRLVKRVSGFHHPFDQPDAQGLLRPDRPACEDEVERPALTYQPGQADSAEVDERDSEAAVEHSEGGVASGDA